MPDEPEYLLVQRQRPTIPGEEEIADMVRSAHESGELRHLYGRPIDLSDGSPNWFITKTLKQQGYTHPALERTRELDEQLARAESIIELLRRRRGRLIASEPHSAKQVNDFNVSREYELQRYRDKLKEINRSIRDYNITVPTALQRAYIPVDRVVEGVTRELPPMEIALPEEGSRRTRSATRSFLRKVGLVRDDGP